jgi:hypothetical protein
MKKRNLHIVAGEVCGLVLDAISGTVNGLVSGTMYLATIDGTQAEMYSSFFGEGDTQFNFEPLLIQFGVQSATGIISVPTVSVGTNSPTYNNILGAMALTGLTGAGSHTVVLPSPGSMEALYGTDIYANVTGAGVGTELTISVDLIGTYQP